MRFGTPVVSRPDASRFRVQRLLSWTPAILLSLNGLVTAWVVFALYPMEQLIFSDMTGYDRRAREIIRGEYSIFHFFQPMGYSLWLALCRWLAGGEWWLVKLTHVAMVWLSVLLGWRVARRILPSNWDLLALALMSLHAQWWALAGFALAETLYTFLITLLLWSTVRWVERPGVLHAAIAGLSFGLAFFKAQEATQRPLPTQGTVLITVADADKSEALDVARRFEKLGFRIKATRGTHGYLQANGIACEPIDKMHEGRPNIVDGIKNGEIQLVINTPNGRQGQNDDSYIRKNAIKYKIPYITTMAGALAAARGVAAWHQSPSSVKSLQSYHADLVNGRGD